MPRLFVYDGREFPDPDPKLPWRTCASSSPSSSPSSPTPTRARRSAARTPSTPSPAGSAPRATAAPGRRRPAARPGEVAAHPGAGDGAARRRRGARRRPGGGPRAGDQPRGRRGAGLRPRDAGRDGGAAAAAGPVSAESAMGSVGAVRRAPPSLEALGAALCRAPVAPTSLVDLFTRHEEALEFRRIVREVFPDGEAEILAAREPGGDRREPGSGPSCAGSRPTTSQCTEC